MAFALLVNPIIAISEELPKLPAQETFIYDIQVFVFPNAAQGTLRIRRVSRNHYRAELMAETTGIVGLVTLYRKNHYISDIEYVPEKGRFFSRHYTKLVYRGPNLDKTSITINHEKRVVNWEFYSNGELEGRGTEPIPKDVNYEDLLSAFFNFRNGVYGPLERGRQMTVITLPDFESKVRNGNNPKKDEPYQKFLIRIVDAKTEATYRARYNRLGEKGLLALVKVPKNLFGQETGEIRIWFDEDIIPVSATVEDAIYFGDVQGELRQFNVGK